MAEIRAFYEDNAQYEWDRLDRHRTEFAVCMRALDEYLPPPPATVLDIGGGPGRYAIALTKRGYRVTLFDLSKTCLDLAERKADEAGVRLEGYRQGNAVDLGFYRERSFDVALLMGPLYHLQLQNDRALAVREVHRVLKPGGRVFSAFITRYAPFRWAARNDPDWVPSHKELLDTGIFQKAPVPPTAGVGFTSAYFAHPSEVKPLMEAGGFETSDLIGCEGMISLIEEKINEFSGQAFEFWVDLNYKVGKDPSLHGAAEHLLYIGRRKTHT